MAIPIRGDLTPILLLKAICDLPGKNAGAAFCRNVWDRSAVCSRRAWAAAPGRSGLALLAPIVQSHQPLDLLVFLLGTNDMKNTYHASVADIRRGMELVLQAALCPYAWDTRKPPKMLLISPTYIYDRGVHDFIDAASAEKSLHLAAHYEQLSKDYGCAFLDAAQVAAPSEWEGLHLDKKGHAALGRAAAEAVRRLMK